MNSARATTVAKIASIRRSGPITPMTVDRSRKERNVVAKLIAAEIISMARARAPTARHPDQYPEGGIKIVLTDGMRGDTRPMLRTVGTRFANSEIKKFGSDEVAGATDSLLRHARI